MQRACLFVLAVALQLSGGGGASSASALASDAWVTRDLGVLPGGYRSEAVAINGRGQVVGTSNVADRTQHAFVWQNGAMTDLGRAAGVIGINERGQVLIPARRHAVIWDNGVVRRLALSAAAFNDAGQVVGAKRLSNGGRHAALWTKGRVRDLGTLGGKQSEAVAINNRGLVVGTSDTRSGASHAFLWRNEKMIDLGTLGGPESSAYDVNERDQIVGSADTAAKDKDGVPISHAFLWRNGTMTDLGVEVPWLQSFAVVAINERGQILVSTDTSSVVWDKGKATRLGTLGGRCTQSEELNDLGDVVGASCLAPSTSKLRGTPHAFVLADGVMSDLGRSGSGPNESRAYAINDQRQIVGMTLTGEIVRAGTPTQTTVQHAVLWTRVRSSAAARERGPYPRLSERAARAAETPPATTLATTTPTSAAPTRSITSVSSSTSSRTSTAPAPRAATTPAAIRQSSPMRKSNQKRPKPLTKRIVSPPSPERMPCQRERRPI